MPTVRRKDVKFCPLCGGPAAPTDGQYSYCIPCSRLFCVDVPSGLVQPSPDGQTFHRECGKKIKHPTADSAFQHARYLPDLPNRIRARLTVYQCRFGDANHWHVGHLRNRMQQNPTAYFKVTDMEEQEWQEKIISELSSTRS
jgi:hypothetical protein